MLLDWLKKDFAKDVAFVKGLSADLSAGRCAAITTREESPAADRALKVAGYALMAFGALFGAAAEVKDESVSYDDMGGMYHWHHNQWMWWD